MELKFDGKLEYQREAIDAVTDLFNGQTSSESDFSKVTENGVIPNELDLTESEILGNLRRIQKQNGIPEVTELQGMDFTVEMETGTGKTYVYLRTILELSERYGLNKFIIVVPSVAIREGVLKTLEITKNHFQKLYGNLPYSFYEYDSKKLSRVRQFCRNNSLEIMVITLDSFNKESKNVMHNKRDRLNGEKPIDLVKQTRPVLILDEPQNMGSEKSKKSLQELNPLLKLRYSATHREYYNLVYSLSPVSAYEKGLVKEIEVSGVVNEGEANGVFVRLLKVTADKRGPKARVELSKKTKSGNKISKFSLRGGEDLEDKTGNPDYRGLKTNVMIRDGEGLLELSDGTIIREKTDNSKSRQQLMRVQIRETIKEHFEKQRKLKKRGIKVLSLFFIDKVANYRDEEGFIRRAFIDEFKKIKSNYREFEDLAVDEVHGGYFSEKYKLGSKMKNDKAVFDLIMKDKERLLSFDEPLQFIFSHSALREGWDNPNVFNICTLNESISNLRKRQEIGRGVRLPVNQSGERITDQKFRLTVVANESYASFVSKLQKEYREEGILREGVIPENRDKRKTVRLRKEFTLKPEFKQLWEKISKKTRYSVLIDEDKLVESCKKRFSELKVKPVNIRTEKVFLELGEKEISTAYRGVSEVGLEGEVSVPNLIELLCSETNLTRETAFKLICNVDSLNEVFKNPKEFTQKLVNEVKRELDSQLVEGIAYSKIGDSWSLELFKDLLTYENRVVEAEKCVYESVVYDSDGEKTFAEQLGRDERVKLFVKLPNWFVVPTPLGNYNPDWAIVFEEKDTSGLKGETLYLVRETKFVKDLEKDLRKTELGKIKCAEKHFKDALKVDFKTVKNYSELLD